MADFRSNCDHRDSTNSGLSYNQVIDVIFDEDSGAPTEPVTLAEAKNFCKIDVTEDDTLITALITAARQMCEAFSNIGFVEREVIAIVNNGNGGVFLPYGPIDTVTEVLINDDPITTYEVSGVKWKQLLEPNNDRVTVKYTGGYATLPENLKTALLNAIFYLYDNRSEGMDNIGPVAKMLLKPISRND